VRLVFASSASFRIPVVAVVQNSAFQVSAQNSRLMRMTDMPGSKQKEPKR